jgi:hypothetical protein
MDVVTRGVQPRINCAARRDETTTNSNDPIVTGREVMRTSANERTPVA